MRTQRISTSYKIHVYLHRNRIVRIGFNIQVFQILSGWICVHKSEWVSEWVIGRVIVYVGVWVDDWVG